MKKTLVGWVIQGIILPSYIGIIINRYKDPYLTNQYFMESKGPRVFLVAQLNFGGGGGVILKSKLLFSVFLAYKNLQGGPLPVITPVTHWFSAIYRGYNSIYNDRRGPPCSWWKGAS